MVHAQKVNASIWCRNIALVSEEQGRHCGKKEVGRWKAEQEMENPKI